MKRTNQFSILVFLFVSLNCSLSQYVPSGINPEQSASNQNYAALILILAVLFALILVVVARQLLRRQSGSKANKRFCKKCGSKLPKGSEFCNKCGTKQ